MPPTPDSVTVAVVCYNEAHRLKSCVERIANQRFDAPFDILLVDGGSTDGTRTIIQELIRRDGRIRSVDNPRRIVAAGRNVAWRECRTELLAFTDADCHVPETWLATLVATWQAEKSADASLAAVGGGNLPPHQHDGFYGALPIFLGSYFGGRNSHQNVVLPRLVPVDYLPTLNVLYACEALEAIGGFDERHFGQVSEDVDVGLRLRARGRTMRFTPYATLVHHQRASLRSWARNMFLYGFGRWQLIRWHATMRTLENLLTLALPLAMLSACFSFLHVVLAFPLVFYMLFFLYHTCWLCLRADAWRLWPRVFALFPVTHFSYAMGLFWGMVSRCNLPPHPDEMTCK
ncbi:MAG: glycosyltransferase [Nitrospirae bacterium]|nr:glycosyltransferase [Magnetococcales bacterium]HAT50166.1 hypothetical protein [Alphaproteobacteria bacterium]